MTANRTPTWVTDGCGCSLDELLSACDATRAQVQRIYDLVDQIEQRDDEHTDYCEFVVALTNRGLTRSEADYQAERLAELLP